MSPTSGQEGENSRLQELQHGIYGHQTKSGDMGWTANWYLTTYENEWNDEHARLKVNKQVERNGKCKMAAGL